MPAADNRTSDRAAKLTAAQNDNLKNVLHLKKQQAIYENKSLMIKICHFKLCCIMMRQADVKNLQDSRISKQVIQNIVR